MPELRFRLPDVGEGVAEAEIVLWLVAVGDAIRRDQPFVEVMTDKTTIEISSPVDGTVTALGGDAGDRLAVGADLVVFALADDGAPAAAAPRAAPSPGAADPPPSVAVAARTPAPVDPTPKVTASAPAAAAPTVRRRAAQAGVDLHDVAGSGPAGRVLHEDLDRHLAQASTPDAAPPPAAQAESPPVTEVRVIGLRRRIAERMSLAASQIPHITYVEEVDITDLERLRKTLNDSPVDQPRLTLLPFIVRAMARAVATHPHVNAHFDDAEGIVRQHAAVHVGIATQTPKGLVVPVLTDAQSRDLFDTAATIEQITDAARTGTIEREQMTGSTITITSLGALGGLMTTPIINHPEVAIVGVNKATIRPAWDGTEFRPRMIMNLSSSFDHRIVDGWDAATFVQAIKAALESPATMFIDGPGR